MGERVIEYLSGAVHSLQVRGLQQRLLCLATAFAALLVVSMCAEESLDEELANATLEEAAGINGLC